MDGGRGGRAATARSAAPTSRWRAAGARTAASNGSSWKPFGRTLESHHGTTALTTPRPLYRLVGFTTNPTSIFDTVLEGYYGEEWPQGHQSDRSGDAEPPRLVRSGDLRRAEALEVLQRQQ